MSKTTLKRQADTHDKKNGKRKWSQLETVGGAYWEGLIVIYLPTE